MNIIKLFLIVSLIANIAYTKTVAIIGIWPLPSLMSFWTDATLVYIPKASYNAMEHSLVHKYRPAYKNAKVGNGENLEELLALNADVYICGVSNMKICNGLKRAGVNVIELTTNINQHNSKKTLEHWLFALSKDFSLQEKNQQLLDYITQIETLIAKQTKNLPKPKAMIIHRIDKDNITSGIFNHYLITSSGAENPWGYQQTMRISLEEIYKNDPDIIYISNFTPTMPQDLLESKEWQNINAVKNKRVYKLPLATYRPFAPSLDLGVTLLFMAKHNHPDVFKDIDLDKEYQQYFKNFFGITLDHTDLHRIFNPSANAGILN